MRIQRVFCRGERRTDFSSGLAFSKEGMGRRALTIMMTMVIAMVIAMVAGWIVVESSVDDNRRSNLGHSDPSSQLDRRPGRQNISRAMALGRLKKLMVVETREAPNFEAFENLASHLSARELEALRDATVTVRADLPGGWVRCAVHAELARRDPLAAMEWLTSSPELLNYDEWGYRQIWFSTFRAWAEVDPKAALARSVSYTHLTLPTKA